MADALQVDHATLFQISTTGALVEGIFDYVKTRAVCKTDGTTSLVEAATCQADLARDTAADLDQAEKDH